MVMPCGSAAEARLKETSISAHLGVETGVPRLLVPFVRVLVLPELCQRLSEARSTQDMLVAWSESSTAQRDGVQVASLRLS